MSLLELENVHSYYGHIHALKGISLTVEEGEVVTLIGANGAGKSTTLRTISGLIHARQGKVLFHGRDITHMEPHDIVTIGVGQVPEGRGIFPSLTVLENLEMGAFTINDQAEVKRRLQTVYRLFPRLEQMLATGRGLMMKPQILLMDEPSMGLAPVLVEAIFDVIQEMNQKQGTTILLVEQNALMALKYAARAYVLETGNIVLSGPSRDIAQNPDVKKAYLGG